MGAVAEDLHPTRQTQFPDPMGREKDATLAVDVHHVLILVDRARAPTVAVVLKHVERFYVLLIELSPRGGMVHPHTGLFVLETDENGAVPKVLAIARREGHPALGIERVVELAG
jgi:hypothetical protein